MQFKRRLPQQERAQGLELELLHKVLLLRVCLCTQYAHAAQKEMSLIPPYMLDLRAACVVSTQLAKVL